MNRLTEKNSQNQTWKASYLRYWAKLFLFIFLFFFSFLLYFNMFLCLVCIYICLFRLVFYFLYIFKHFRLLDLSFQVLLCFSAYLFSGLGFSRVCVRILLYAHAGSKYAYAYNWPAYAGLCMHMHTHAQKP